MPEIPYEPLLNRSEATGFITAHCGPQLELLTQMANYSSNLIPRAFHASARGLGDSIVLLSLLKQFTSMIDAVDVLARNGSIYAGFTPARAAFESSLYIEWMLVSDLENKAKHYLVGDLRNQRDWARKVLKGTPEQSLFSQDMGELGAAVNEGKPTLQLEAQNQIHQIDKTLADPKLADVNDAFQAMKKPKRPDPLWYQELGKRSIRSIAKELLRLPEYEVFYSLGSRVIHSTSYREQIAFLTKGVNVSPIRSVSDSNSLFNFAFIAALTVFDRVLGYYRPAEKASFYNNRYRAEWRTAFLSVPKLQEVAGNKTTSI